MFVTNWISTTKIQKISEITNFFRHYFLSRTEVIKDGNGVSAIFLGTVVVKVLVFCCFLNVFIESLHFWCIKNVNNS